MYATSGPQRKKKKSPFTFPLEPPSPLSSLASEPGSLMKGPGVWRHVPRCCIRGPLHTRFSLILDGRTWMDEIQTCILDIGAWIQDPWKWILGIDAFIPDAMTWILDHDASYPGFKDLSLEWRDLDPEYMDLNPAFWGQHPACIDLSHTYLMWQTCFMRHTFYTIHIGQILQRFAHGTCFMRHTFYTLHIGQILQRFAHGFCIHDR